MTKPEFDVMVQGMFGKTRGERVAAQYNVKDYGGSYLFMLSAVVGDSNLGCPARYFAVGSQSVLKNVFVYEFVSLIFVAVLEPPGSSIFSI